MIAATAKAPHSPSPGDQRNKRNTAGNFACLVRHLGRHDSLRRAIAELEQLGTHNPAAAIDLLIAHHDAVAAYGCPNNTPRHVITCAGAEGEGPTPGDALHAWTIRARYLLAGAIQ